MPNLCSLCDQDVVHGTPYCEKHLDEIREELKTSPRGMKFSDHKVSFKLLPLPALIEWAETYNYGAEKYEEWNWLKGRNFTDYLDSIKRHLYAFENGENRDPSSNCHHLAQVMFGAAAIIVFQALGRDDLDDRVRTFINSVSMLEKSVYNKSQKGD